MQTMTSERAIPTVERADMLAAIADTSLGPMLLIASSEGIHRIEFADRESELRAKLSSHEPRASQSVDSDIDALLSEVVEQIDSPRLRRALPTVLCGTPFQRSVWQTLRTIPMGETISYTQLAQRVGRPEAVRAVASACAANQIAVLIPCHRVLRSDGGLGGYRWGLDRKQTLLQREALAVQGT